MTVVAQRNCEWLQMAVNRSMEAMGGVFGVLAANSDRQAQPILTRSQPMRNLPCLLREAPAQAQLNLN